MHRATAFWVAVLLTAALLFPAPATADSPVVQSGLNWIEFSLGGVPRRVKAGGVLAVHPDTPFKVKKVETDSWFEMGVKAVLSAFPKVDLYQFQTLTDILGPDIYKLDHLVVEVRRAGANIGQVELLIKLLPIDWLRKARSSRDLNEKIAYTKKALELTPDDPLLVKRLVILLEKAQRYQEAVDLLAGYPTLEEGNWVLETTARLYRLLDQPEKEAAALSKLLAEAPADRNSLRRLAGLYQKLGKWSEAAAVWQRLLPLLSGGDKAKGYRNLAQALGKAGRSKEAAAAWDAAVKLKPTDPDLWKALAKAKFESGDQKGGLEALRRAVALASSDWELWSDLTNALLANGEQKEAARAMELQHKLRPKDQALLTRLARLYEKLGDRDSLLATYRKLSALRPDDHDLAYNLSVLTSEKQLAAGEDKKAAESLEMAAALNPRDTDLLLRLSEIYGRLGDKKAQASIYQRLIELEPRNPTLYYNLAVLTFELRDYGLCLESLDQAAKLKPDDAEIQDLTLETLLKLKKYQRLKSSAVRRMKSASPLKVIDLLYSGLEKSRPKLLGELLDQGIALEPKNRKLYELSAGLALERENAKAAMAVLEKGAKALPNDLTLWDKLASLYEAEGQPEKALAALEKILDKEPDNKKAEERYTRIRMSMLRQKSDSSSRPRP